MLDALTAHDCQPRERAGRWLALCPAHDDTHPSLSVGEGGDHRVLVVCRAGCPTPNVVAALGLEMRDLFPQTVNPTNPMEAWNR